MLSQLYIENVAVIEKVSMDLHPGLNVLTGETGAGKSILINSINMIAGNKASKDIIRTGANNALVSAAFSGCKNDTINFLDEIGYGLQSDEDDLLIQRVISSSGRGTCKICGKPANVSIIKSIGKNLIAINGQNNSYDLLEDDIQLSYIDKMGNLECLLDEYKTQYKEMCRLKQELSKLEVDETLKARKIDLLEYQIREIEDADLIPGELEELLSKKLVYSNYEKLSIELEKAKFNLDGNENSDGILQKFKELLSSLSNIKDYFPSLNDLYNKMENVYYEIDDCFNEVRNLDSNIEYNPNELENIENRLDTIYKLTRKYGENIEDIISFLNKCKEELNNIISNDEKKDYIYKCYSEAKQKTIKISDKLSEERTRVLKIFSEKVKNELYFLGMPNIQFEIEQKHCKLKSSGCDEITFLISTNSGEIPKPLSKIASGGELSRIMLAIKSVLAKKHSVDTLIFDEIDSGVSGATAQKIGFKLKEISKYSQVICVTHSAQIAALADRHFLIKKETINDRTFTNINSLDFKDRKIEIARIIGGVKITDLTLQNASEMLNMAGFFEN